MASRSVDILGRSRRRMLLGFAIAFIAWQVPTVLDEVLAGSVPDRYGVLLTVLAAVAGIVCLVFAIRYVRTARAIARDASVAAALDDERVRAIRNRSYAVGFWTIGGFLIATRLLALGWDLSASAVAQIGLIVAVAAPIVTFVVLDRE